MNQNTESEAYEKMFKQVANEENWKLPTKPYKTDNKVIADAFAQAIIFYVGGAEVSSVGDKNYTVTSKGYYHYIGA